MSDAPSYDKKTAHAEGEKSHTTHTEHSRAESPGQRIIEDMTPEQRMASLKAFAEDRKMVYPGMSYPALPTSRLACYEDRQRRRQCQLLVSEHHTDGRYTGQDGTIAGGVQGTGALAFGGPIDHTAHPWIAPESAVRGAPSTLHPAAGEEGVDGEGSDGRRRSSFREKSGDFWRNLSGRSKDHQ